MVGGSFPTRRAGSIISLLPTSAGGRGGGPRGALAVRPRTGFQAASGPHNQGNTVTRTPNWLRNNRLMIALRRAEQWFRHKVYIDWKLAPRRLERLLKVQARLAGPGPLSRAESSALGRVNDEIGSGRLLSFTQAEEARMEEYAREILDEILAEERCLRVERGTP
jgi:hypothetical protein